MDAANEMIEAGLHIGARLDAAMKRRGDPSSWAKAMNLSAMEVDAWRRFWLDQDAWAQCSHVGEEADEDADSLLEELVLFSRCFASAERNSKSHVPA